MDPNLIDLLISTPKLVEIIIVASNLLIAIIPKILLSHFINPNIPENYIKFQEIYDGKVKKVKRHILEKASNKFDKSIVHTKSGNKQSGDEEKRDSEFFGHLFIHESFF